MVSASRGAHNDLSRRRAALFAIALAPAVLPARGACGRLRAAPNLPAAAKSPTQPGGERRQRARDERADHRRRLHALARTAAPTPARSPRTARCCEGRRPAAGDGARLPEAGRALGRHALAVGAAAQDRVGLMATVPKAAHSGHIKILLSHGRYTSSYGPIYVFTHALHPPLPKLTSPVQGGRHRRRRVRRPGHVDLVREQFQRRLAAGDHRPGARGGRDDGVRQELRRLEQLLEPVLAPARRRSCTPPA